MTETVELKPCPFCGCDDIATETTATDGSVRCRGCLVTVVRRHLPRQDVGQINAIAAWNTRPDPAVRDRVTDEAAIETWMLEPAAIYLEMVDDDETGSNVVVANFLRSLATLRTSPPEPAYVIWSSEHVGWWAPKERGYVKDLAEAGLYSKARAMEIAASQWRMRGGNNPNEIAMPLQDAVDQAVGF